MSDQTRSVKTETTPVTIGLLAHVDAGKTTLAEAMLYTAGKLQKLGRVDHQDAFLDTYALERERGITIFSKQAQLMFKGQPVTLLDTPGHVDFSPETERTLQVLDYAILVISGPDGVQGHVMTLWRLLSHHQIPVFLFINKMDQEGCEKEALMRELNERLSDSCIDFSTQDTSFYESLATGSEEALEEFLETGRQDTGTIRSLIRTRSVFPCYFGSALKLAGIEGFLDILGTFAEPRTYPDIFGARIFKIMRDEHGERLTFLKITGASLKVKTTIQSGLSAADEAVLKREKIHQIRIYDGAGYTLTDEAKAGTICAVTGPELTRCGDGLGCEKTQTKAELIPVLTYQVLLPEGCDIHRAVLAFLQLEEEEPQLHVVWKEAVSELHVQVMGAVQIEILKSLVKERFDLDVDFGAGSIIYKETIQNTAEGVGHFEPLRHYAEVHLLLEPGMRGSGMVYAAKCSEDLLDKNWQRLILTHLNERVHSGVLTGSALTDVKVTLKSGRAHAKHTEGGDFREATYRAVRQGLMQAKSVLLEPYYSFRLEVPSETIGRAISDIQRMSGTFEPAQTAGDLAVLTGRAPVAAMRDYPVEVVSYTRGTGRISCEFCGYDICHNPEEVIAASGYDPERDTDNPASSIFCAHGSGFVVPWDNVPAHMHLESVLEKKILAHTPRRQQAADGPSSSKGYGQGEKDLKEIFERTYGSGTYHHSRSESVYRSTGTSYRSTVPADSADPAPSKPADRAGKNISGSDPAKRKVYNTGSSGENSKNPHETPGSRHTAGKEEYLLVDGYNIIFAWDELNELAKTDSSAARGRLMDILCNYQGYMGMTLILVFDAYRVENNPGETFRYHNIHVVYTKEAETADQYIEKTVRQIERKHDVTVATSDALEQVIILGGGARRMSAAELYNEIDAMTRELRSSHLDKKPKTGHYLFDDLTPETAARLEAIRLGKKT